MEWKSMGRINYPIYEMENKSHVWNYQPVNLSKNLGFNMFQYVLPSGNSHGVLYNRPFASIIFATVSIF